MITNYNTCISCLDAPSGLPWIGYRGQSHFSNLSTNFFPDSYEFAATPEVDEFLHIKGGVFKNNNKNICEQISKGWGGAGSNHV
jgi:hypothetical protein